MASVPPSATESEPAGLSTVRVLGTGSSGHCFLMQAPDGTHLVQKRVPVSHMSKSEQEVAEREVNILGTLRHPYIVRYHKSFVREGQLCIVMEHASGGDLASHLESVRAQGGVVGREQALEWFVQLVLALQHVHAHRVLHRDLGAKNVFLSARDGRMAALLGDFGVSRVLEATDELARTKVGTPCYISPERCEGLAYSYASDVWALGCILYELLAMRAAFVAPTIAEIARKIIGCELSAPLDDPVGELTVRTARAAAPCPRWSQLIRRARRWTPRDDRRSRVFFAMARSRRTLLTTSTWRASTRRPPRAPSSDRRRQPQRRSPSRHTRGHRFVHVAQVEIPLVGYDGCSKTRFSERPTFLEGGRRIVDGAQLSNHDRKLLAARERRRLATGRSSDPAMPAAHGQGGAHSGSAGSDLLAKRWSASDLSASLNRDSC